jgi:hypothetical protein
MEDPPNRVVFDHWMLLIKKRLVEDLLDAPKSAGAETARGKNAG